MWKLLCFSIFIFFSAFSLGSPSFDRGESSSLSQMVVSDFAHQSSDVPSESPDRDDSSDMEEDSDNFLVKQQDVSFSQNYYFLSNNFHETTISLQNYLDDIFIPPDFLS